MISLRFGVSKKFDGNIIQAFIKASKLRRSLDKFSDKSFLIKSLLRLSCIIKQSTGKENISLTLGKLIVKLIALACCEVLERNISTVCDALTNSLKAKLVIYADFVVIILVRKGERNNTCINKVCAMYTGKRLGDDRLNSEIERNKSGMLA